MGNKYWHAFFLDVPLDSLVDVSDPHPQIQQTFIFVTQLIHAMRRCGAYPKLFLNEAKESESQPSFLEWPKGEGFHSLFFSRHGFGSEQGIIYLALLFVNMPRTTNKQSLSSASSTYAVAGTAASSSALTPSSATVDNDSNLQCFLYVGESQNSIANRWIRKGMQTHFAVPLLLLPWLFFIQ